jgi:acyl-CoA ligase (AMP-forming) (exosortase A-associated)
MTLLHEMVDATTASHAQRIALVHGARRWTYGQMRERSERLAPGLASLGVARADRVVVFLQNRAEVAEVALACSRLGAIFVPANPLLRSRQLQHVIDDSGARVLVTSQAALGAIAELATRAPGLSLVICDAPAAGGTGTAYEELMHHPASPRGPVVIDQDAAAILYTSGSTGRPKGVVLSHRNLVSGARCVSEYLGNHPDDRLLAALPLSFDYGFSQLTTAFAVGACAVTAQFSTAAAMIQDVQAHRITGLAGVPTMWAHLADSEWPAEAAQCLRYITNSGGVLLQGVLRQLQRRLPDTAVFSMYGLTEAFRSTYLPPAELAQRAGSIGKAIPNQEILVLRPDGTGCAPGEVGELVHRGSLVTLGYWNDPELTRQRFRPLPASANAGLAPEIAVFSGDRVRTDEDGFLYFVGRADGLIKVSGHRVSPTEIEEVLLEVPGVVEGVAVGVADEVLGQRIVVGIVVSGDSAGIVEAVRQATRLQLPSFMVPAQICVMNAIPRNVNGKHDRAAVVADLNERLARGDAAVIDLRNPR